MARTKERSRLAQDERGAEVLEFVGMMPWLLLVGLVVWQLIIFGHCMLVTASAARDGARAVADHQGAGGAVGASMGGAYPYRIVQAGGCSSIGSKVRVTVEAKLPIIDIPYVPLPDIWTRHTATMPCEPPW